MGRGESERESESKSETDETDIDSLPPVCTLTGLEIEPASQVCTLD